MMEPASQTELRDSRHAYQAFSFELGRGDVEGGQHFLVAVKNITSTGVILELVDPPAGLDYDSLKGRAGNFTVLNQNDGIAVRIPGTILWHRGHDGDGGATLGLELLEPLPLPVRHTIEANMAIGARDMKVLWDYWDEIQAGGGSEEVAEAAAPAEFQPETVVPESEPQERSGNGNWVYLVGFGAILSGLAMQFPQSEALGLVGLAVMFFGSLVVAWKSVMSMWQVAAPGPVD